MIQGCKLLLNLADVKVRDSIDISTKGGRDGQAFRREGKVLSDRKKVFELAQAVVTHQPVRLEIVEEEVVWVHLTTLKYNHAGSVKFCGLAEPKEKGGETRHFTMEMDPRGNEGALYFR